MIKTEQNMDLNQEKLRQLSDVLSQLDGTGSTITQIEFSGHLIFLKRDENGSHAVRGVSKIKPPKEDNAVPMRSSRNY